ncbi:MAG: RDD family protein [Candidatus Omnitrophica bacterium]|nr:RDD family protein [Candidatus Omnitrophota bacterium]
MSASSNKNALEPTASLGSRGSIILGDTLLFAIQCLLAGGLVFVVALLLFLLQYLMPDVMDGDKTLVTLAIFSGVMTLLVPSLYFIYPLGKYGKTHSMEIENLKLTYLDGSRVGYGMVIFRFLLILIYFIPVLGWLLFIISIITILCSKNHQALHDMICNIVVRDMNVGNIPI